MENSRIIFDIQVANAKNTWYQMKLTKYKNNKPLYNFLYQKLLDNIVALKFAITDGSKFQIKFVNNLWDDIWKAFGKKDTTNVIMLSLVATIIFMMNRPLRDGSYLTDYEFYNDLHGLSRFVAILYKNDYSFMKKYHINVQRTGRICTALVSNHLKSIHNNRKNNK